MVILSTQYFDNNINNISIKFFEKYPNVDSFSKATVDEIQNNLTTVNQL